MRTKLCISLFTVATLALAVLAFYEIGIIYVATWLYIHPVSWWLYASVAIMFAVALMPLAPGRHQRARLVSLLVILTIVAALYLIPWNSRKPFLRDLGRVRIGMKESEVRHIMSRYIEGTGWPASPFDSPTNSRSLSIVGSSSQYSTAISPSGEMVIRDSLVFRHSTDGAFNSDWGIVSFSGGVVIGVEFSPD